MMYRNFTNSYTNSKFETLNSKRIQNSNFLNTKYLYSHLLLLFKRKTKEGV